MIFQKIYKWAVENRAFDALVIYDDEDVDRIWWCVVVVCYFFKKR